MKILSPSEYFRRIHRITELLDENNVRIVQAMKQYGPRNLQLISRKLGMPYPTLFSRVSKLESEGVLHLWAQPSFGRVGLERAIVTVTPQPGKDLLVKEALTIPNYWIRHVRCMGECNGYFSVHAVPSLHKREFEEYLDQLIPLGLASNYRLLWLGDQESLLTNFDYYDYSKRRWRFDWTGWLKELTNLETEKTDNEAPRLAMGISDRDRTVLFDYRDLLVMKELSKDARVKLAELARIFGTTLPAAKYRFDSVIKKGLIKEYVFDVLPYAPEISDLYEVRLDFKNDKTMISTARVLHQLPFVLYYSPVKGRSTLTVRVSLPRGEINNLLTLLSSLADNGVISNYTYLLIEYLTLKAQTFAYQNFKEDAGGWQYDNREYNMKLQNLLSQLRKGPLETAVFEPMSMVTIQ